MNQRTEEIDALLTELEGMRKTCFPRLVISIIVLIVSACMFLVMLPVAIVGLLVGVLMLIFWYRPVKKIYADRYKQALVNGLFNQYFDNINYEPNGGLDERFIASTGFMMMGNVYHSEDLITGSYKGVQFRRADVTIQDETTTTDSDGNTRTDTTTYFQGRWIVLSHNKHFQYDLQLVQKGFGYSKTKTGFFTRKEDRRHVVEFENEAFNKNFKCYCQNDEEAFYLITPQIMEEVMEYVSAKRGKLMLGFQNDYVHVALHTNEDSLEPSIFRKVSYENDIVPIMVEVDAIRDFVDKLNMDRNIFKG